MKIIKYKYRKVYILEWKREANSHIEFLPKNLNFKKIIKKHEFHGNLIQIIKRHSYISQVYLKG